MDQCENCERRIGKLETPYIFKDKVVCGQCHKLLGGSADGTDAFDVDQQLKDIASRNSLASTATVRSTWTPNTPLPPIPKKTHTGVIISASVLLGWLVISTVIQMVRPDLHAIQFFGFLIALLMLGALVFVMVRIPVWIAKDKGRYDKVEALGVLAILGMISLGLFWIVALVWALGLEKRTSRTP